MTVVTTEVTYDVRSMKSRLERKNTKDSLAYALAKIWDMSAEHPEGIPASKVQCVLDRVIQGNR